MEERVLSPNREHEKPINVEPPAGVDGKDAKKLAQSTALDDNEHVKFNAPADETSEEKMVKTIEPSDELLPILINEIEEQTSDSEQIKLVSAKNVRKTKKEMDRSMLKYSEKLEPAAMEQDDSDLDENFKEFMKARRAKQKMNLVDVMSNLEEEEEPSDNEKK